MLIVTYKLYMLSVVMLSVVMLNVVAPFFITTLLQRCKTKADC